MIVEECWNKTYTSIEITVEKTLNKKVTTKRKPWYDKECQLTEDQKNRTKVKMI